MRGDCVNIGVVRSRWDHRVILHILIMMLNDIHVLQEPQTTVTITSNECNSILAANYIAEVFLSCLAYG